MICSVPYSLLTRVLKEKKFLGKTCSLNKDDKPK